MSETTAPQAGAPQGQSKADPASFEAITSQDQLDAILRDRLGRERAKYADYSELKAKAAKFDETVEASKSELQKALDANAKLASEAAQLRLANLRSTVADTKKLPTGAAEFLTGSTRVEIEASADRLAGMLTGATQQPNPVAPRFGNKPITTPDSDERAAVRQLFNS